MNSLRRRLRYELKILTFLLLGSTVLWVSFLPRLHTRRLVGDLDRIVSARYADGRRPIDHCPIYPSNKPDPGFGIGGCLARTFRRFPAALADPLFLHLDRVWSEHLF